MKCASIGLAVCVVVTGLIAAYHWYQSSLVQIDPGWTTLHPEPLDEQRRQMDLNVAVNRWATAATKLNKTAALWTALSVALSGAASIVGAFS